MLETLLALRRYRDNKQTTRNIEALAVTILRRLCQRIWRCRRLSIEDPDTLDTLSCIQPCTEKTNHDPSHSNQPITLLNPGRRQRVLIQAMLDGHSFQWVADQLKTNTSEVRRIACELERRIQNSVRQFP